METIKISQDQFERLLGAGNIYYCGYSIYSIHWYTHYSKIAIFVDSRNDEKRIVQLKVE